MENETNRKLVTIRNIKALNGIPGADAIEVATIDGWEVVVKKGEFKEGDLCVYFEVDSVLPRTQWFEFLVDKNRPEKPIRLRTIKLRGQISQGLALPLETVFGPLNILGQAVDSDGVPRDTAFITQQGYILCEGVEGLDQILGVTKYEPPISAQLAGISRGNFPIYLNKTDEERIENCFETIDETFSLPYYASLKLDGSSATFAIKDDDFVVCSRNINLKETEGNKFWQIARELDIEVKLRATGLNVAIQGELVGPGIQGNKDNFDRNKLFIFNVFDIDSGQYYDYINMLVFVQQTLGLETVPIIEVFEDGLPFKSVKEIKEYATRKSFFNPTAEAEGIVFRPKEVNTRIDRFGRVSFKSINPLFLLKNKE